MNYVISSSANGPSVLTPFVLSASTIRHQKPGYPLADIARIVRKRGIRTDEASLPLRCALADNGTCSTPGDTERVSCCQLIADEVGAGAESLAQRAEEAPARVELEEEAYARRDHQVLVSGEYIIDDRLAVAS
ncbi:hypothetical protein RRF57_012193 [Xylaria bambusicola]|uniref:Uncharacterized protein n=1 Tax=Xylaria bambusicola TaxID=326684 RepID=A0AAN7V1G7_9PEZI